MAKTTRRAWSEARQEMVKEIGALAKRRTSAIDPARVAVWLDTFSAPISDVVSDALLDAGDWLSKEASTNPNVTRLPYAPFSFESLLRSSAQLLDKCLAYRKEMNDLAI